MLTFKEHEPIVDPNKGTISIWNDEANTYEVHSFEFIEDLYMLTQNAGIIDGSFNEMKGV